MPTVVNLQMLSLHNRPICGQILGQISDDVSGDLHGGGRPGIAGRKLRIDSSGVVNKIGVESGSFDLILAEVAGKLMD